ncbi:MAG: ATP-binding protein, partial [Proteobacteria bacterium]|nr:ATP-binding protein [Pseudomonadota bacterium]
GRITFKTGYRHDIRLNGRDRTHLPLEVRVRDNGSGIANEIRPYVFDAFVTTRHGGTGLGLALVAKVIAEHGGTVDFESDELGTEFRVRLPIADDHRARRSQ